MTPPNPLGSSARLRSTVRAARLYVLVRDAYLATPAITLRKLAALEELRRGTTDNCDAPPQPDDCSPPNSAACGSWSGCATSCTSGPANWGLPMRRWRCWT